MTVPRDALPPTHSPFTTEHCPGFFPIPTATTAVVHPSPCLFSSCALQQPGRSSLAFAQVLSGHVSTLHPSALMFYSAVLCTQGGMLALFGLLHCRSVFCDFLSLGRLQQLSSRASWLG